MCSFSRADIHTARVPLHFSSPAAIKQISEGFHERVTVYVSSFLSLTFSPPLDLILCFFVFSWLVSLTLWLSEHSHSIDSFGSVWKATCMKARNISKQCSIKALKVGILFVKIFVLLKKICWTCATLALRTWSRLAPLVIEDVQQCETGKMSSCSLLNSEEHTAHGEALLHTSCHEVCEHSLISASTEHALGYQPACGHGRKKTEEWSMWTACLCRVVNLVFLWLRAERWVCWAFTCVTAFSLSYAHTCTEQWCKSVPDTAFLHFFFCEIPQTNTSWLNRVSFAYLRAFCLFVFALQQTHSRKPLTTLCS